MRAGRGVHVHGREVVASSWCAHAMVGRSGVSDPQGIRTAVPRRDVRGSRLVERTWIRDEFNVHDVG